MPDVSAQRLRDLIEGGAQPIILDVRSAREYENGHVPGAVHIPFWKIATAAIPATADDPIVVYCGHGPRAMLALVLLARRGYKRVACLQGHMSKWRGAGWPEERGSGRSG